MYELVSDYAVEYAMTTTDPDNWTPQELREAIDKVYTLAKDFGVEHMDTPIPAIMRDPLHRLYPIRKA